MERWIDGYGKNATAATDSDAAAAAADGSGNSGGDNISRFP